MKHKQLVIDEAACRLCRRCLVQRACRSMAVIRFDLDEPPVIDMARCKLCLSCAGECPFDALIIRWADHL